MAEDNEDNWLNWLWSDLQKKVTRVNDYIFKYKASIMYAPCLISAYAAFWSYYDRSDIRREPETNATLMLENEKFILLIVFSLTASITNIFFLTAQGLSFMILNGTSLWRKADENKKLAIYGMALAVVYGILCYLLPVSIIMRKHLTMEREEIDGYLPELYLIGRLGNLFYVTHYFYIRTSLQPAYFPALFSVIVVYVFNVNGVIHLISGNDEKAKLSSLKDVWSVLRSIVFIPNFLYTANFLIAMYYKKLRVDEQTKIQEIAQERKERAGKKGTKRVLVDRVIDIDINEIDIDSLEIEAFSFKESFCINVTTSIGILLFFLNGASIINPDFKVGSTNGFALAAYVMALSAD